MSQFQIYQGEIGLRNENAQLKTELARLRADNARLKGLVGEELEVAAAPLISEVFAHQTSNGAKIGPLEQANRPAAVVAVMGAPQAAPGQTFENGDGCKVTIGAPRGDLPALNPAIAAARAARGAQPGRPVVAAPTPVEPELAQMVQAAQKANAGVDAEVVETQFSMLELHR